MGLNGVLPFKNSNLREVIKSTPLEKLLIETDAPYLTPVPFRGKRNESSYVKYVCQKLAEVFGVGEEIVDAMTTKNAEELFLISIK
jgi:TatD DNase family protein